VRLAEHLKMDAAEERTFFYRALHERLGLCLDRFAPPEAAVVDAGCGTGGFLLHVQRSRPALNLAGVDASPVACRIAREKTGLEIQEARVERLPYPERSLDAIVSADVLSAVGDPLVVLREFARRLRPGGIVVLNLPAYHWLLSYHDEAVGQFRRFTRGGVERLLLQAGFRVELATYWNVASLPLAAVKRKLVPDRSGHSDVKLYPPVVERALGAVLSLELRLLRRRVALPFGLSVLAVGSRL
jgi:SAM-dependent methyltransferase